MQTNHYMANMGNLGRAERLGLMGLERVDDLAGLEQRQVVADLDLATGRSAEADRAQSGLCPVRRTPDGEAQPA
jgi:hypothetical protein